MLDLAPIKAREAAATEGPWASYLPGPESAYQVIEPRRTVIVTVHRNGMSPMPHQTADSANAAFISHARTDIPALVAEVEANRAELAELCLALDTIRATCEAAGFMREIDVADPESSDPAPIRTSRSTPTIVTEMAAELRRGICNGPTEAAALVAALEGAK